MVHILIVDDEVHAVRGLQAGVDWSKLHVSELHTAHSMKQAQDIYAEHQVDLMICDIEMPQGSGMELLGWVREHYPQTETVFLTCHSDFNYAKKAIQLDSFDYLLKPVDYAELEGVLGKAIAKIRKAQEQQNVEETFKRYYRLWETYRPHMKERFWHSLIQQTIPSLPDKIKEQLETHQLQGIEQTRFIPVLIRIDRWYKQLSSRDEQIVAYALRKAAEEQIGRDDPNAAVIPLKAGMLLAVVPHALEAGADKLKEGCGEYIRSCNRYFYCDVCCYAGEPAPIAGLTAMVGELVKLDEDNVTAINETIPLRRRPGTEEVRKIELPPAAEWAEWMKQGAKERLMQEVSHYFQSLREAKECVRAPFLHTFYQGFLQWLFFVLQTKGLQANQVFAANLLTEKPEAALRSVTALEEWVSYIIEVAMNHIHSIESNMSIVDKVKQYVSAHISEPGLSREDIAGHVFLNPDYLTRVFKKETGMSISDYMQQQRIEYAKELLAHTDASISDVGLSAGYSNLSYFSTIFKKFVHMNPGEYRKQFGQS